MARPAFVFQEGRVHRYSVGDRVSQLQYGPGTITAVNERHTTIAFDEHGSRTFITAMVRLEPSDTEQPVKPKRTRKAPARKAAAVIAPADPEPVA